jgi:hypothetical protein
MVLVGLRAMKVYNLGAVVVLPIGLPVEDRPRHHVELALQVEQVCSVSSQQALFLTC